jgi:predicted amidohydrolase
MTSHAGASAAELGIQATQFTLNGTPTFLLGLSYYGALGAREETVRRDLDGLQQHGFNWLRVWATWDSFSNEVSAVDFEGNARAPFLEKLQWLVAECDRRGVVVDVTLSRGRAAQGLLPTLAAHRRAVETLVTALKPRRNWYVDLANERNVRDARFVSFAELKELRDLVKRLDPSRLVTASDGGDISREDLREYLMTVGVDFACPHRPREASSPGQTEAKSREYVDWMKSLGRNVPLHYQEPFRRGYGTWAPSARDFLMDLSQAKAGGAAGWCFHNGDQRDAPDHQPRRSFDLRQRPLFEQFDEEEREFLAALLRPGAAAPGREPERTVRVVVLQAGLNHSKEGNPGFEANFARLAELARQAAVAPPRPDLICFPEYAISGWPYPGEAAMNSLAEAIPGRGRWFNRYRDLARAAGAPVLGWLVESAEGKLYNAAFLLDAQGTYRGKYRKVHANLGEQTWWGWSQGERFELLELDGVRYGVSLCADMWFPETVRCQELLGADVVLHLSIADDMGHIIPVRAFDSRVPIVAAIFQGGSYAVDAQGKLLGKLPAEAPAWTAFALQPFRRHLGRKFGSGLWDEKKGMQNARNLGAYDVLIAPAHRPPWTEVFLDDEGRPQTREQILKRFDGRYDVRDSSSRTNRAGRH